MILTVTLVSQLLAQAPAAERSYSDLLDKWIAAPACAPAEWKSLPAKFDRPTLVLGKCVKVDGAVSVGSQTLVLVARELQIGPNAAVNAGGKDGDTGKANGNVETFPHGKANSTDQCLCGNGKSNLYGGEGTPGAAGGNVKLLARQAQFKSGAKVVIGGGIKGEHGTCGVVDCPKYPGHSAPCCDPGYARPRAAAGTAYFGIGGSQADAVLKGLRAAVDALGSPTTDSSIVTRKVDADVAFRDQALEEVRAANKANFDIIEAK